MSDDYQSLSPLRKMRFFQEPAFYLLAALVAVVYFARVTALPIVGEEARWARGAAQMLETGDWIVLRQQGHVFPERPPLTCWAMAVTAMVRGQVDAVAIRLPSVVAVWLTALLIYVYARSFLTSTGALVAGLVYATFGQVLQIGRHGESEALFTLLLGGALLMWHLGYLRGWPRLSTWTVGYSLAALAALVKGPQAPIYFAAVTWIYLAARCDWRWLLTWRHLAGIASFVVIVAAWQIPYYLATDWAAVHATWAGLAGDRFNLLGLLEHMVSYPVEILICLLPWSPLLALWASRKFRDGLGELRVPATYLATAVAITFPSVWWASGARGRYFMPLYPCLAVLVAVVVQRCATAAADAPARRVWRGYLMLGAITSCALGLAALVLMSAPTNGSLLARVPASLYLAITMVGLAAGGLQFWASRDGGLPRTAVASLAFAGLLGLIYTGAVITVQTANWHNPQPAVEQIKEMVPQADKMVSLGPLNARFAYFYRWFVQELPWPQKPDDLPEDVEYFFVMRYPGDTPQRHRLGRGRTWTTVPGTLPFAWEEVARVNCGRHLTDHSNHVVVLARVVKPESVVSQADQSGRPQNTTVHR